MGVRSLLKKRSSFIYSPLLDYKQRKRLSLAMSKKQESQDACNFQTVIENLEKEYYLKPEFNSALKNEVKLKIEEFSSWFNSTARLCLLKCGPIKSEAYVYLLLNLKKKLKLAISEINKSVSKRCHSYTCNVCNEEIGVQPWQNIWNILQDHPHFEECYNKAINGAPDILKESSGGDNSSINNSVEDDLNEELIQASLPQDTGFNDFKFNFKVACDEKVENTLHLPSLNGIDDCHDDENADAAANELKFKFEAPYDERVEKTLYPENLVRAAHKADGLFDYTVQRHSTDQAVCLLCPCSLIPKGKISKISPFVIKSHVYGRKHLKNASITVHVDALKNYHEFWRKQDAKYQAHQLYFIPEIAESDRCKCQLCKQSVHYGAIINHIKTNQLHKTRVCKILKSPKEKLNEFALFDMQVEMYEITKNKKKQTSPKKEISGNTRQKCVFAKFVIKPNQVNLQSRYKSHLKFFTKNSDLISCRICKISFYNSTTLLRRHILSAQHSQLSGIPLQKYTFFCGICKMYLKDEDQWDKHFTKGLNNHDNIPQGRRLKVAEYECSTCNCVIYGDQSSLNCHISSRQSKETKSQPKKMLDIAHLVSLIRMNWPQDEQTPIREETTLQNEPLQKIKLKQETQIGPTQCSSIKKEDSLEQFVEELESLDFMDNYGILDDQFDFEGEQLLDEFFM